MRVRDDEGNLNTAIKIKFLMEKIFHKVPSIEFDWSESYSLSVHQRRTSSPNYGVYGNESFIHNESGRAAGSSGIVLQK